MGPFFFEKIFRHPEKASEKISRHPEKYSSQGYVGCLFFWGRRFGCLKNLLFLGEKVWVSEKFIVVWGRRFGCLKNLLLGV